jgi:hypothetical protein
MTDKHRSQQWISKGRCHTRYNTMQGTGATVTSFCFAEGLQSIRQCQSPAVGACIDISSEEYSIPHHSSVMALIIVAKRTG